MNMSEEKDMNVKQRRVRGSNFSKEEELSLVLEVEKFKNIIECKTSAKISNTDKNEAWKKIESAFNSNNNTFRNMPQLKNKYDNLEMKARRTVAEIKYSWSGTDGGPASSAIDDLIIEAILRIINKVTVVGLDSKFDSDAPVPEQGEIHNGENIVQAIQNEEATCVNLMVT